MFLNIQQNIFFIFVMVLCALYQHRYDNEETDAGMMMGLGKRSMGDSGIADGGESLE